MGDHQPCAAATGNAGEQTNAEAGGKKLSQREKTAASPKSACDRSGIRNEATNATHVNFKDGPAASGGVTLAFTLAVRDQAAVKAMCSNVLSFFPLILGSCLL